MRRYNSFVLLLQAAVIARRSATVGRLFVAPFYDCDSDRGHSLRLSSLAQPVPQLLHEVIFFDPLLFERVAVQ